MLFVGQDNFMVSYQSSPIEQQPLAYRCLALTGAFETSSPPPGCFGHVCGNFDGQGISFSALQWNLGQGTVQTLLQEMNAHHPDVLQRAFGGHYPALTNMLSLERAAQLDWSRSIQTPANTLLDPWTGYFRELGQTEEFQTLAVRHAGSIFQAGLAMCSTFELQSQRAAALLFDIRVQNGGIRPATEALILEDFARLQAGTVDALEAAKLRVIANRVADTASPKWQSDVRTRKLTIATGAGSVHGVHYDLAAQYGLTLAPIPA